MGSGSQSAGSGPEALSLAWTFVRIASSQARSDSPKLGWSPAIGLYESPPNHSDGYSSLRVMATGTEAQHPRRIWAQVIFTLMPPFKSTGIPN